MACGKVVIGSKMSFEGINAEHGKHCYIIDSENPAVWAKAIKELSQNTTKIKEIGEAASLFIRENFTWKQVAEAYQKAYEEVIR